MERYDRMAQLLHWVIALLILTLIGIGFYMTGLPRNTPPRAFWFNLHKSLGLLAAALILVRILWRSSRPAPALPATMPPWQAAAARTSHRLLYLLMVLQPLTGYLASSFNKYGIKFFGLALPHWGWEDKFWNGILAATHRTLAIVFVALIAVHVAAALKHWLVDRDTVLRRMLPL